jgi:hypothetical protein
MVFSKQPSEALEEIKPPGVAVLIWILISVFISALLWYIVHIIK